MSTEDDVSRAAATMGRKGGKAKVPKGLAVMDAEQAREIRSAGGRARWKNAPKKEAAKKAPKKRKG